MKDGAMATRVGEPNAGTAETTDTAGSSGPGGSVRREKPAPAPRLPSDWALVGMATTAFLLGILGVLTLGATLPGAFLLLAFVLRETSLHRRCGWSLSRVARIGRAMASLALVAALLAVAGSVFIMVGSNQALGGGRRYSSVKDDLVTVGKEIATHYYGSERDDPPLSFTVSDTRRVVTIGWDSDEFTTVPLSEGVIVSGFRFAGAEDWCVSMMTKEAEGDEEVAERAYLTFSYSNDHGLNSGDCLEPEQTPDPSPS